MEEDAPEKTVKIGANLPELIKEDLMKFLRAHKDVFAWTAADMPGINPESCIASMSTRRTSRLGKRGGPRKERQKAIDEEVEKLLNADFIKEVQYPDWLANGKKG